MTIVTLCEFMRPQFAIYLVAGLTLCAAAMTAALGIINKVLSVPPQAHPDAVLELRAPDDTYQSIGIALLLVAAQLVVILCARTLNNEKHNGQAA